MGKKTLASKEKKELHFQSPEGRSSAPEIDRLVEEIIARIADKWTLLLLEALAQHGTVRFSRLADLVGGISQKMLTQTLRRMEADGFITRTAYPEIPPRVEYALTPLGESLGAAFCGVWEWAEKHHGEMIRAREAYSARRSTASS